MLKRLISIERIIQEKNELIIIKEGHPIHMKEMHNSQFENKYVKTDDIVNSYV